MGILYGLQEDYGGGLSGEDGKTMEITISCCFTGVGGYSVCGWGLGLKIKCFGLEICFSAKCLALRTIELWV